MSSWYGRYFSKRWYVYLFHLIFFFCVASGVAFYFLNNFMRIEGDFGLMKHPWQLPILKLHAFVSFILMILFGYFLSVHVQKKLSNFSNLHKKGIFSGVCLLVLMSICILTAYGLFYVGDEVLRCYLVNIHFFGGVTLMVLFFYHCLKMKGILR